MGRFSRRLTIALFTTVVGVGISVAWFLITRPLAVKSDETTIPWVEVKQDRGIVMAGHGLSPDGYPTSFSHQEFSDGTIINQMGTDYRSSRRATAELQKRMKKAESIIRREPVLDQHGRRIGERVVATFVPYKGSSAASAELLWTEGSRYVSQRGRSLKSILNTLDSNH